MLNMYTFGYVWSRDGPQSAKTGSWFLSPCHFAVAVAVAAALAIGDLLQRWTVGISVRATHHHLARHVRSSFRSHTQAARRSTAWRRLHLCLWLVSNPICIHTCIARD